MLELILLDGSGRRFSLADGTELKVGVAAQCAVRLSALDVSRTHALVTNRNGRLIVLDLGSTNGTFVNGKRVKEAELAAGDLLRFSSVMAQVVPQGGDRDGDGRAAASNGQEPRASPAGDTTVSPTSDTFPAPVQESLASLLFRWSAGGCSAQEELVRWLVGQRRVVGAAVLETIKGDITVVAAEGEVSAVLEDPGCEALLIAKVESTATPEEIITTIGGRTVVAMRTPGLPWLLLVPGAAMPEFGELALIAPLLAVARRLDLGRGETAGG
ncbi:MAG TPA: FHA domain-containing protein [Thermoanaerobaculaceae bacterium]|nr:FHA domain-containing protein [Thermoanaerobaculaceae bacterium]